MPRARRKRIPSPAFLLKPVAVSLIIAGSLSLIWMKTRVMEVRYEIAELEQQRVQLLNVQKDLLSQKSQFSSPARIAMRASRLGLTVPDRENVYLVKYQSRVVAVANHSKKEAGTPRL
ncbi:MAG: hypothetical protein ACWGSD_08730 [Thermodesulfobacteriota bacterium]